MTARLTRLKRVVQIRAGGTPSINAEDLWSTADEGFPWVTIGDMSTGSNVASTTRHVSPSGIIERRLPIGEPGTVLFAMYASVGALAELAVPATWNQAIVGLSPIQDRSHGRFVRYWLEHLRPTLLGETRSNTQDNLNAEQVANLPFPHIPITRQEAIADFLDTETARIDALITRKQQLIGSLREFRAGLIAAAVEQAPSTTSGARLRHFVSTVVQGWSPQCASTPADGVTDWGVLKAGAANGGVFRPHENKALPPDETPRPELVVRPGQLIISRANTRELVGSAAVVEHHYPRLMLCDKLYALHLDDAHALPQYVSLVLGTRRLRDLIEIEASGSSPSMQNISRDDILNLPINLPPLEDQVSIVEEVRRRSSQIDRLVSRTEASIELLREHRQALITAAVTGELEVPGAAV